MNKERFICLCNFIEKEEVITLLKKDIPIDEVIKMTGMGTSCGRCIKIIKEIKL